MGARQSALRRLSIVLGALGTAALLSLVPTSAAVAAPAPPAEILPPVAVGDGPFAVAVSPDGDLAYVLALYDQTLDVIDTATNTLEVSVPLSLSFGLFTPSLVVHPDGRVLILDPGDGALTEPAILEVDPATWTVYTHSLALPSPLDGAWATAMTLTPDGTKAYVADTSLGGVLAVDVPPTAGPGAWTFDFIDVAGATTPEILPGSLAIAGGYLYVVDILGEDASTKPTGIAVIRIADDQLEPTVIGYTAPAGTIDGILSDPIMQASPDGSTVLISAAAEIDDGSGDFGGFFWTIPAGTIPATATYLGPGLGDETAAFAFSSLGQTVYMVDCACAADAWTLDLPSGDATLLDLSSATDLDLLASVAVSPDGTKVFFTGYTPSGTMLWQLSTVADDALTVTGPATVDQGDSVTLTAAAHDNSGNPIDVTTLATFTSDVATDVINGNVVTFPTASPHTITASYAPVAGGPVFAAGAHAIEVAAILPPTGSADPRPAVGIAGALLLLGAALLIAAPRLRRAAR